MLDLIDIGVNLAKGRFEADRDQVITRARAAGVRQMIVTGTDLEASEAAAELASSHTGGLFATAGVHPHHAKDWAEGTAAAIRALAVRPGVVAIGECGLDFDRNYSSPADQEGAFAAQLQLASESGLPLFLHEREAHARMLEMLDAAAPVRGVLHCFTGGPAEAEAYLKRGLHLGVTGWLCDERRGDALREAVKIIPGDRLLLETDAPFLYPRDLPWPLDGEGAKKPSRNRNEPAFLPHVAKVAAALRGEAPGALAAQSSAAARALFGLPEPDFRA